jgi:D-glycero-beta-D-manno-heptose-7-phosphate kinase
MTPTLGRSLIKRFAHIKALVIGDLMLDHFLWGSVSRISPEAPVPVVDVSRETEMPGGAGNVAINMASLGAEVFLAGVIGEDLAGERLVNLFQRYPIHLDPLVRANDRPTIVKTRVIAHHQQVVRFDRERRGELPKDLHSRLWQQIEGLIPRVDAIVLSDYGKGVVSTALIQALIPLARRRGIPITVDPKIENFSRYKQVTCVTPNMHEAMTGAQVSRVESEEDVERLGELILKRLNTESVLITRGEKGMSLFERKKPPVHIPTRAKEVYDVTGAGDTVISTLTLALAAGAPLRASAELANYAAGIVVGKLGTAAVSRAELEIALRMNHHG